MILRSWRGRAAKHAMHAYVAHAKGKVLPQLAAISGYKGALVLTDESQDPVEIVVLTLWSSMNAIRAFAGPTPHVAVVEPDAHAVLTGYDETVRHYDVAVADGSFSST
jgi:heme-degrading monooxygenase HmoA